ncbi:hypothetical protein IJ098_03205 [Candidatus Saccharibacteria bacterium]|nr:hypothetical protein [Candidatus Saccharibacteria bacterium]
MTKTRKKIFRLRDIPVADKAGKIFGTATRSADEKECATILAKFGYAEKTKRSVSQVAKDCIKYCDAMPTKVIIEILLITKKQYLHLTKNELYL